MLSFKKCIATITLIVFLISMAIPAPFVQAQSVPASPLGGLNLPAPGTMVPLSVSYNPAIVKGVTLYPDNPLKFDFIIDPGDDNLQGEILGDEASKLIKYFMASLTVPEDEMWVNLSPYEEDRIIANGLSQTELGRDLLAQDYILKQLTASLMYPEEELGDTFWKRVYAKAQEKYNTSEIPMDTFNKVWIVPEKANVYVNGNHIFVVDNHLKVMLEEDYLALDSNLGHNKHGVGEVPENQSKEISDVSSEIIREVLIPEIEREVNQGKNFANLRQIYNSMILATWYKQNLRDSLLGQIYINQNKINGIDIEDKHIKEKIYNQYIEAFKKGVFNYIKEDYVAMDFQQKSTATSRASARDDEVTQQIIPRKYFSGGFAGDKLGSVEARDVQPIERNKILEGNEVVITGFMKEIGERENNEQEMNLVSLHGAFEEKAKGIPLSEIVSGIKSATGENININARIIDDEDGHLGIAGSYYFRSSEGDWIIVLNKLVSQEIREEGKFHEATEIALRENDSNFSEHEIHVIASALQRQKFSRDGKLTAYDEFQIKNVSDSKLMNLEIESRDWHFSVLVKAYEDGLDVDIDFMLRYHMLFQSDIHSRMIKKVWGPLVGAVLLKASEVLGPLIPSDLLASALIIVGLTGPVSEELLSRRFIQKQILEGKMSHEKSVLLGSVLFALTHPSSYLYPQFLSGIVYSKLYAKTGKLWPSILLHGFQNASLALGAHFAEPMLSLPLYIVELLGVYFGIDYARKIYSKSKKNEPPDGGGVLSVHDNLSDNSPNGGHQATAISSPVKEVGGIDLNSNNLDSNVPVHPITVELRGISPESSSPIDMALDIQAEVDLRSFVELEKYIEDRYGLLPELGAYGIVEQEEDGYKVKKILLPDRSKILYLGGDSMDAIFSFDFVVEAISDDLPMFLKKEDGKIKFYVGQKKYNLDDIIPEADRQNLEHLTTDTFLRERFGKVENKSEAISVILDDGETVPFRRDWEVISQRNINSKTKYFYQRVLSETTDSQSLINLHNHPDRLGKDKDSIRTRLQEVIEKVDELTSSDALNLIREELLNLRRTFQMAGPIPSKGDWKSFRSELMMQGIYTDSLLDDERANVADLNTSKTRHIGIIGRSPLDDSRIVMVWPREVFYDSNMDSMFYNEDFPDSIYLFNNWLDLIEIRLLNLDGYLPTEGFDSQGDIRDEDGRIKSEEVTEIEEFVLPRVQNFVLLLSKLRLFLRKAEDSEDLVYLSNSRERVQIEKVKNGLMEVRRLSSSPLDIQNPGGIDLNPNNLDLNIQGDEIKIDLSNPQMLNNISVDGFIPVIINVAPVTNIPMLIGGTPEEKPEAVLSQL